MGGSTRDSAARSHGHGPIRFAGDDVSIIIVAIANSSSTTGPGPATIIIA